MKRYYKFLIPALAVFLIVGHGFCGSVTQANIRISAVDGTAFIDFSAAGVLTNNLGKELVITDSAGKTIRGIIKAAGTGETLDTEEFSDSSFDNTGEWIKETVDWSVTGGQGIAVTAAIGSNLYQSLNPTTLALFRSVLVCSTVTGGTYKMFMSGYAGTTSPTYTDTGTKTHYHTRVSGTTHSIQTVTELSAVFDSLSLKQVLTPSTTGVTIVSTSGGAIYNWKSKETGFNYNDSSGYTYTILNSRAPNNKIIEP